MWDEEYNQQNCYVRLFLDDNDNGLVWVDYLQRISEGDDCDWKWPRLDDIQDVDPVKTVPCAVHGEWCI